MLTPFIDRFIDRLFPSARITLIRADGTATTYGRGGEHLTVRITRDAILRDLFRNPRLALGEAYMEGELTVEDGSILDLLTLLMRSNPYEQGGIGGHMPKAFLRKLRARFRRNPAVRAKRNVAHHYDLDDRLYALFLDEDRQYSCAYFRDPGDSLDQAQSDKKIHIAAKLDLRPGQRVLDIGCGWGGMGITLHRLADVEVLGVTLSEEQLKVARARAEREGVADRVKFELIDYREVQGRFDRIVSVGMFEHVGAAHYPEFFHKCRELMTDDGVMLLHTIGKYGGAGAPDPFIDKWIFPGYHVPSLAQMSEASQQARLMVSDVETLRLHYALTLRHWLERCHRHRREIESIYDARFFRMWEYYLAGCIAAFEFGPLNNFQVQYVRDRRALPIARDYMAEAEERYRSA